MVVSELMAPGIKVNFLSIRNGDFSYFALCLFLFVKFLNLVLFIVHQIILLLHLVVTSVNTWFLLLLLCILGPAMFCQGNFASMFMCSIMPCSHSCFNHGAKVLLASLKDGELVQIATVGLSSGKGGIRDAIQEVSDLIGLGDILLQIGENTMCFLVVLDIGLESVGAIPVVLCGGNLSICMLLFLWFHVHPWSSHGILHITEI